MRRGRSSQGDRPLMTWIGRFAGVLAVLAAACGGGPPPAADEARTFLDDAEGLSSQLLLRLESPGWAPNQGEANGARLQAD